MELKSPKTKKKTNISKLVSWGKMVRIPLLIMFLLGSTSCDLNDITEMAEPANTMKVNLFESNARHRHARVFPKHSALDNGKMSELRFLRRHLNKKIVNFIVTDVLVDGEVESRVHYNGVTAKETYAKEKGSGLRLRQLTDGRHFLQIIYSIKGEIQDCEYIPRTKSAKNFLKNMRKELKQALDEESYRMTKKHFDSIDDEKYLRRFHNATFRVLTDGDSLPKDVASWLNFDKLKMECLRRHEELKYMAQKRQFDDKYTARPKRGAMELLRVPGTKWCGKGFSATRYSQLGGYTRTDRCCRVHDLRCPFWIGGMEKKYGLTNMRVNTLMHCRCDERFRACLKLADTSVSNLVGNLFFNMVQSQCFVLKRVKMCTERTWSGRCAKRDYMNRALLRNNLPY